LAVLEENGGGGGIRRPDRGQRGTRSTGRKESKPLLGFPAELAGACEDPPPLAEGEEREEGDALREESR